MPGSPTRIVYDTPNGVRLSPGRPIFPNARPRPATAQAAPRGGGITGQGTDRRSGGLSGIPDLGGIPGLVRQSAVYHGENNLANAQREADTDIWAADTSSQRAREMGDVDIWEADQNIAAAQDRARGFQATMQRRRAVGGGHAQAGMSGRNRWRPSATGGGLVAQNISRAAETRRSSAGNYYDTVTGAGLAARRAANQRLYQAGASLAQRRAVAEMG